MPESKLSDVEDVVGAPRIRDVAEASGLPVEAVSEQLSTIRAETSFRAKPRRSSVLLLSGAALATLAVGVAVMLQYARPIDTTISHPRPVHSRSPAPPAPITTRQVVQRSIAGGYGVQSGPGETPPGIKIDIVGGQLTEGQSSKPPPARAMPYEEECRWIADAGVALAEEAVERSKMAGQPLAGTVRDWNGTQFTPRKGWLHYSIGGWAGTQPGWLKLPLDASAHKQLLEGAQKLFDDTLKQQERALELVADVDKGVVSPPPGFTLDYFGRRMDHQEAPRISFAPIDPTRIGAKLEQAIENAIRRDGRPPVGRWTENAAADARIPWPKMSRVQIIGAEGEFGFDVPTENGWGSDSAEAVRRGVKEAEDQMREYNRGVPTH